MLDRLSVPIKTSPSIRKKSAPLLRLARMIWIVLIRGPVRGLAVLCLIVLIVVVPGVATTLVSSTLPGEQGKAAGVGFALLLGLAAAWLYRRAGVGYHGRAALPVLVEAAGAWRRSNSILVVLLVTGAALMGHALSPVRRLAAAALGFTGRAGVPLLLHAVEDRAVASAALSSLGRLGPTAAPAVEYLLQYKGEWDLIGEEQFDRALLKIGPPVVPELLASLKNPDEFRREWASRVLAQMPSLPSEAAVPLVETLEASSGTVMYNTQKALQRMGPRAAPALPQLLPMLIDGREQDAAPVLQTMGPAAAEAVPALIHLLQTRSSIVATHALGGIGAAAVPSLRDLLHASPVQRARACACQALGLMGPAARDALPEIRPLLHSGEGLRRVAAVAWTQIGGDPSLSLPILLADVRSGKDYSQRHDAAQALVGLGPQAAPALPEYEHLLKDRSAEQRARAAGLIGALKEKGAPAVEALADRVRWDISPRVRAGATAALRRIGPAAAGKVPEIQDAMPGLLKEDRLDAALAVCELGRNPWPLADWLRQGLEEDSLHPWDFPAEKILKVARELGPEARPLVPVLEAAYQEKAIGRGDLIRILYPIDRLHGFLHDDDAQARAFGLLLLVCILVETLVFRWRWTKRRPVPVRVGAPAPLPRSESDDEHPLAGL